MEIFVDGWKVLLNNRETIIILLVTIWGLGRWGTVIFFDHQGMSLIQKILFTMNTGTLLMAWSVFIVVLLGQLSNTVFGMGSTFIPLAGIFLWIWSDWKQRGGKKQIIDSRPGLILGFCLFIHLILRLAFLKEILLPPYDDSPEHYLMIKSLLNPEGENQNLFYSLENITQHYYHFGFHAIAAWLTRVAGADPANMMVLLGQIFIVISSLSVFMLVISVTENIPAGVVAAAFATFAWRMPAFAANWGKYPALTGLAFLPGWLGLLFFYMKSPRTKIKSGLLSFLILAGLSLIHTRLAICLILIGLAVYTSPRLLNHFPKSLWQVGFLVCLSIGSLFVFIKPINVFYSSGYFLPIVSAILLLPFAASEYPRYVLALTLIMLGIWGASKAPFIFEGYGATWLDAPFIELILYIPLSLFTALGFAGLINRIPQCQVMLRKSLKLIAVLLGLFGLSSGAPFLPDECCNYVTREDLDAITWLGDHSSPNAVVWIAGFKPKNYMLGMDAGIWISALTGRNVNKLRYDFDWDSATVHAVICQKGYQDVYIYKGGMPFSFDDMTLRTNRLFDTVYKSGSVKIYQIGCHSE